MADLFAAGYIKNVVKGCFPAPPFRQDGRLRTDKVRAPVSV